MNNLFVVFVLHTSLSFLNYQHKTQLSLVHNFFTLRYCNKIPLVNSSDQLSEAFLNGILSEKNTKKQEFEVFFLTINGLYETFREAVCLFSHLKCVHKEEQVKYGHCERLSDRQFTFFFLRCVRQKEQVKLRIL